MKRAKLNKSYSAAGFTLIELVIAITLFVLIAGTGYSALTQVLKAATSVADEQDLQRLANAIIQRLTRELQMITVDGTLLPPQGSKDNAYPRHVHVIAKNDNLDNGRPGSAITFVAADAGQYVPDGKTHSGVVQITYRAAKTPPEEVDPNQPYETFYLVRDEVPLVSPAEEAYKKIMTFPVSTRLISLKFRFYNGDKNQWVEDWEADSPELPEMIEFTLEISSPKGRVRKYSSIVDITNPN